MTLVLNTDDCYRHPKKRDTALFKNKEVSVYSDAFDSLLGYYAFDYNAEDKKSFTSICDRLLEDSDRRRKGDFYTPTIWVDEAHKMLTENLGSTWKDDYMVWDCACGTLNLTRDYKFFDLYCSTIIESDLKIGNKYNQEAGSKFQYDFLNDDVVLFNELLEKVKNGYKLSKKDFFNSQLWYKAPDLINGMLSGKKMLFFINPPYGTATNRNETSKGDISLTKINKIMLREGVGASAQQLYAQFLYNIDIIKHLFNLDVSITIFSPTIWLTGGMGIGLRKVLKNDFSFVDGMLFQASHFADVKSNWGISFTIFKYLKSDFNSFNILLKDMNEQGIYQIGTKKIYNLDDTNSMSNWLRKEVKGIKAFDAPQMKGALTWNREINRGRLINNSYGYLVVGGNNTYQNNQMVIILSSCYNTANGVSIIKENLFKCCVAFAARRLITGKYVNWINDKDEYMLPDIKHNNYNKFESDSLVYCLFNTASNQSSLRHIEYNNQNWNIANHFFFMSIDEMNS